MSAISVEHLSRWWGATRAVDDVSFEAAAGQLLVLLGPSGCGKSTTLRLIAGLERATARAHPHRWRRRHGPAARRAARCPWCSSPTRSSRTSSWPRTSCSACACGAWPRPSAASGSPAWPSCSGSSALLARKPSQLSGGQQQRVALGRAIIAEKPVCLMDEPLSNLDAQLRARDAPRDPGAPAEARHHHGLRHARPDRGHDHGRPGHPAARRPRRAGRAAGRRSTRGRPPCSPRASSARRP